jgi:hypothetical protein
MPPEHKSRGDEDAERFGDRESQFHRKPLQRDRLRLPWLEPPNLTDGRAIQAIEHPIDLL